MAILFVDDEVQRNRSTYLYLTEVEGFTVHWARTPKGMLQLLEQYDQEIEVILLDIMMPIDNNPVFGDVEDEQETGIVLLDYLEREWPNIPVIVLSARYDLAFLEKRDSVRVVLRKPLPPDALVRFIRQAAPAP